MGSGAGPDPRTVLYVHSSAGRYGADRQLLALATGLDPARYRALVALPDHGPLAADLRAAGIEVRVRELGVLRRALLSPGGLARVTARVAADAAGLGRLIAARDVALVHSNTSVTLGGAVAARARRLPHVYSVREIYADFKRLWPPYRRLLLATGDVLCCSSEATRAQFGDDPRARVVHEGVTAAAARANRAQARAALGLPADAFVCVVLGRISSWKGQDVLARALAEPALRAMGAIGVIAGDAWPGEERHQDALQALAADLELGDRLRFVGFREDTANLYGAADVIAVPSTQPDPLPNSALEAAAAGCCVVAAAHGGLREIFRDGVNGRLIAPRDPGALATVLAELAADPAQRERLGAAAADDVAHRFSLARVLTQTQSIYDELLGAAPGRTRTAAVSR